VVVKLIQSGTSIDLKRSDASLLSRDERTSELVSVSAPYVELRKRLGSVDA
jgi:hypothetical protein